VSHHRLRDLPVDGAFRRCKLGHRYRIVIPAALLAELLAEAVAA
jgi:hypothetical protein